jgi:hypothetical protein
MRVLGLVVQAFVAAILGIRQRALDGRHVTRQFVSDDHPRLSAVLRIKHTMQEALCGLLIAPTLDQDVQHRPILIDGAPQPIPTLVLC